MSTTGMLQVTDSRTGRSYELPITDGAIRAIAVEALNRKVGARGLRMILEELMLDLMYHLPGNKRIKDFEVTAEMVTKRDLNIPLLEKAG